jgi:hypothetical protein
MAGRKRSHSEARWGQLRRHGCHILLGDPSALVSSPQPDPTPSIESYATSSRDHHDVETEEILEAEIVEPEGEPADDTPPRIAEMIKGVFDRRQGSDRGKLCRRSTRTATDGVGDTHLRPR